MISKDTETLKIQYCSDLHLEFPDNLMTMRDNPLKVTGDALILAGDIMPFTHKDKYGWFLDWASDHFSITYWIPGNHEYYGYSIESNSDLVLEEKIRSNVILLNNRSVEIEDSVIHFSTLWSCISQERKTIQRGISDFFHIKYNGIFLQVEDYNYLHEVCKSFLIESFAKHHNKKTIVVTHHVPSLSNYPREFIASNLREAFSVELEGLIRKWQPVYWIYGHHHSNVAPFVLGQTTMLTNQLGYVHMGEFVGFENDRTVSI